MDDVHRLGYVRSTVDVGVSISMDWVPNSSFFGRPLFLFDAVDVEEESVAPLCADDSDDWPPLWRDLSSLVEEVVLISLLVDDFPANWPPTLRGWVPRDDFFFLK